MTTFSQEVKVLSEDNEDGLETNTQPVIVKLGQNFYRITYTLTTDLAITIKIYSLNGNLVYQKDVASGEEGGHTGFNSVVWNGKDAFGNDLGRGVYLVRLLSSQRAISTFKFANY